MKNNFDDLIICLNAMSRILPQQQEIGPLATLHGSNVPAGGSWAVHHGNIAVAGIRLPLHIARGKPPTPFGSNLSQVDVRGWRFIQHCSYRLFGTTSPCYREIWCIKFPLTEGQVLRLLCIGGRCNLFIVRSIQSTEKAHDEPNLSHRAIRARASGGYGHGGFDTRLPVGVADHGNILGPMFHLRSSLLGGCRSQAASFVFMLVDDSSGDQ
jgi:hypothetical protein